MLTLLLSQSQKGQYIADINIRRLFKVSAEGVIFCCPETYVYLMTWALAGREVVEVNNVEEVKHCLPIYNNREIFVVAYSPKLLREVAEFADQIEVYQILDYQNTFPSMVFQIPERYKTQKHASYTEEHPRQVWRNRPTGTVVKQSVYSM